MSTIQANKNIFSVLDDENKIIEELAVTIASGFPTLEQSAKIPEKTKGKKFNVATSYNERKFFSRQQPQDLSKTLLCTKPCNHVLKKVDDESGKISEEHGVCYREVCTFAHSLAELQLPRCAFADRCYRRNDAKNICQFSHPGESVDDFYTRTGKTKPDLPETSSSTRKPKKTEKFILDLSHHDQDTDKPKIATVKEQQPNPIKTGAWTKPITKKLGEERVVMRVPKELAQSALEIALSRGLTDFSIETF